MVEVGVVGGGLQAWSPQRQEMGGGPGDFIRETN